MSEDRRIALLIDADNISEKYIRSILDEISLYGSPTYKRIYGDWTTPQMSKWKPVLLEHSITPIQQYRYTCLLYTSYMLYNNKASFGSEAAEALDSLRARMARIGYEVVCDRGDYRQPSC